MTNRLFLLIYGITQTKSSPFVVCPGRFRSARQGDARCRTSIPSAVWRELYNSDSPPGETITQYIANEYAGRPHVGETPPQIIKEVLAFAAEAVEQIDAAAPHVTRNKEEFGRLRNDVRCVEALSKSYCAKVNAAMMVHRYRHSSPSWPLRGRHEA